MKKLFNYLTIYCLLFSTLAMGQEIIRQDVIKFGKSGSTADKFLQFDFGLGSLNPSVGVDSTGLLKFNKNQMQIGGALTNDNKDFIFNGSGKKIRYAGATSELQYDGDKVSLGDGTNTDKTLKFNKGASSPEIKYNATTGKLQFTNNAVDYKDIGSGSGGGSTGTNLALNDSFEDGVSAGWTNVGGTFSSQTYTNSSEGDTKYARFVASGAGQYFESTAYAVPSNFSGGCQADFKKYNTVTSSAFKIEAMDSTGAVIYATQTLAAGSFIKAPTISFVCPVAATLIKIRVTSLLAGTIEVDRGYIGSNQNIVQSQCQGTVGCEDTFSALVTSTGVVSSENLDFINGNCTNGATGQYTCTFNTGIFTVTPSCTMTNTAEYLAYINSASSVNFNPRTFNSTGTPTNAAFQVHCQKQGVDFVKAKPVDAVSNEQSSWFIDANIGGQNPNLGVGTVSSYSEIVGTTLDIITNTAKGSSSVEIACANGFASVGANCGANNESIGISFFPPSSGLFEACFDFAHYTDLSTNGLVFSTFQVVETPNTSTTIVTEGGARVQSGASYGASANGGLNSNPQKVCGTFNFPDTSKKTLRLMYEQLTIATVGLNDIRADRNSSYGQRDIKVTVRPLLSAFNRPILTSDQVTSKGELNPIILGANVGTSGVACTTATCTINQKIGSNISSVTRSATGAYSLNLNGLTQIPICTATINPAVNQQNKCQIQNGSTLTSVVVLCFTPTPAPVDEGFSINCFAK